MDGTKKIVTRVLSKTESKHILDLFEEIHCYSLNEAGEPIKTCPGWDWNLQHLDEHDNTQAGGCKYKDSSKLCKCLSLAAEDFYVLEVRPKNEDDIRREREVEKSILERHLRDLKNKRSEIEEAILSFENKIRNL